MDCDIHVDIFATYYSEGGRDGDATVIERRTEIVSIGAVLNKRFKFIKGSIGGAQ